MFLSSRFGFTGIFMSRGFRDLSFAAPVFSIGIFEKIWDVWGLFHRRVFPKKLRKKHVMRFIWAVSIEPT
jgi:hypothetical protein